MLAKSKFDSKKNMFTRWYCILHIAEHLSPRAYWKLDVLLERHLTNLIETFLYFEMLDRGDMRFSEIVWF